MGDSKALISDWEQLSKVPPSSTHRLDIGKYNGWIIPLTEQEDKLLRGKVYLSTHTFYGLNHERSTKVLQGCGFNVVLSNWDE